MNSKVIYIFKKLYKYWPISCDSSVVRFTSCLWRKNQFFVDTGWFAEEAPNFIEETSIGKRDERAAQRNSKNEWRIWISKGKLLHVLVLVLRENGRDLTQSYYKNPYANGNSRKQSHNKNAIKMLDYTVIVDQLRMVREIDLYLHVCHWICHFVE